MSLLKFKRAVMIGQLPEKDREWFPRWFAGYAKFVAATNSMRRTTAQGQVRGCLNRANPI